MPLNLNDSKLPWHRDRVVDWLQGQHIAPITVDMALTQKCNLKCEYCYAQLQQNPGKALTQQQIHDLFTDFATLGVKGVSLVSDGESTCHPYWRNAITYAKCHGLDVAIGTNGVAFHPFLLTMENLTYVRFNISAMDPDRYAGVHGTSEEVWEHVINNLCHTIRLRDQAENPVVVGVQMVLLPHYADQIMRLARLCRALHVDYFQVKHCSDDELGSLGVDYDEIRNLEPLLQEVEQLGTKDFQVIVKWRKIMAGNKRLYRRCYATPFHLQISGSGLIAPCGMFFHPRYKKYHIGSLHKQRFIDIFNSKRYWEVMRVLASDKFDAQSYCGCLCLQDSSNIYLNGVKKNGLPKAPSGEPPAHVNFL